MKILFGLNNDETTKGIIKAYEDKFKEKVEYKNVYYFKQIVNELSTGEFDRAVILEELEKFPTNNFAQIDEYLFTNLDAITDVFEAKNIVYIASDRRSLGDDFLAKLFNLGIYTVLTNQNRTKGKLCSKINKPDTKKDIKKYYEDSFSKNVYKNSEVSELEIQKIVNYYINQNGNSAKYSEIFDSIITQYTDEQLNIIIQFLPSDVKQYLLFNNEKYKFLAEKKNIKPSVKTTPTTLIDANTDPNAIEIKNEPQIIEKIVIKEVNKIINAEKPVITEVIEKEIQTPIYQVPGDYKKVICFVGASKVGTTFLINAVANTFAKNKINTAIVDMTRKKDTFTIYTYDSEGKKNIASQSLKYASSGLDEPLVYDKLRIYTAMPGEDRKMYNASKVIETVMKENKIVLTDADFTTPIEYFKLCNEIYLVQDMDVLNIGQTTLFLRELKMKNVSFDKIKLIINKHVKCALTSKDIIDGISTYSSYDLKMYEQLFSSSKLPYYIMPFNEDNYRKYVEMIYKYTNTFNSFTDEFKNSLNKILNSIYPMANIELSKKKEVKEKKSWLFKKKIPNVGTNNYSNIEKEIK